MVRSIDSNEEKKEPAMRVGDEYQAEVPEMLFDTLLDKDHRPEPLLVWAPCDNVSDDKMDEYLRLAKDKHGYNMEQALGLLYWHKYDIEKTTEDLKHFTPLPDEWSMEDQVIFEQSFSSYGKHFPRIRQQLPDKSIGTLVRYYYTWKKSRNKKSLMDKSENRDLALISGIFADDSNGDNDSSDSDYEPVEKRQRTSKNTEKEKSLTNSNNHQSSTNSPENKPSPMLSTNCVNCAGVTQQMNPTPRGKMCTPCYDYWRRTGIIRPRDKDNPISLYQAPQYKLKKKPPKGMLLNAEMLVDIAQTHGDSHIRPLEVELINLKRQIMTDKQILQEQAISLSGKIDQNRPLPLTQKLNPRWTNEELLIAVQCVRKYGKDFEAMAEVLGNKNVTHCRNFFINHRRRFNLMEVLAEYEKENNIPRDQSKLNDWSDDPSGGDVDMSGDPYLSSGNTESLPAGIRSMENGSSKGPPPLVSSVTVTAAS